MRLLAFTIIVLLTLQLSAQKVWIPIHDEVSIIYKSTGERDIIPEAYANYELDLELLKYKLLKAPAKDDNNRWNKAILLEMPLPDGSFKTFSVIESPVMSPVLAEKFPNIKTYLGVSSQGGPEKIRFELGPEKGFHAAILTNLGQVYIDPYFTYPDENYISYFTRDIKTEQEDFASPVCGLTNQEIQDQQQEISQDVVIEARGDSEIVNKHIYRMAIACTGEWGARQGSVAVAMERIVSAVNRMNMIYENEAAVFFELIDNNDELIFLDPDTDPYDPFAGPNNTHAGRQILGQNSNILNSVVGQGAYDIGHVVTVSCTDNIGGVAAFGSLCGSNKGTGVSCDGSGVIGGFALSTLAHEVGHQFACSHSWSNCPGPLATAFEAGTAYEPGSGSTIMSYSGGCQNNNNTGVDLLTFHSVNIEQIYTFITFGQGSTCGQIIETENHCPEVSIPYKSGMSIPISTPLELSASAFDIDNDNLSYSWEQFDAGIGFDLGTQSLIGPQFAVVGPPNDDIVRLLPDRNSLLTMNWNNPLEIMPFGNRIYNFRLIARDNHPEAGYAAWDQFNFNSNDQAGPFVITFPNNVVNAPVGSEMTVTWDVANTDLPPVNCKFVDIYISTDGGANFDSKIVSKTLNDGEASIIIPNDISNLVRVKVKAVDNIFFNVSFPNFRIVEPDEPGFYFDLGILSAEVCLPNLLEIPIQGTSFQEFSNEVLLEVVDGLPDGAEATFIESTIDPSGSTVLILDLSNVNTTGTYEIVIQGTAQDANTIRQNFNLDVVGTDFSDLALLNPAQGSIQMGIDTFKWSIARNAELYNFMLATSPSFESSTVIEIAQGLTGNSYVPETVLDKSTLYYWRVTASNKCADDGASEIFSYATEALSCELFAAEDVPRNITQSGAPTIESKTFLPQVGQVSDVNIKNIKGLHENMGDLIMSIISPAGTEVVLYDRTCFSSQDFNAGFDDESSLQVECPLANNRTFNPVEKLSSFNGEDIMGDWILKIADTQPGNGGQLQGFDFQICSNKALDSPILVNNERLTVRRGFGRYIENIELLTTDENNSNAELIYTLVKAPGFGVLTYNGDELEVGMQWTQQDIDDAQVLYINDGDPSDTDDFEFTVIDGEGGWVGITTFNIEVSDDDSLITAVVDIESDKNQFNIHPNPAQKLVFIENLNKENQDSWEGQLLDITGRIVNEFEIHGSEIIKLDLSQQSEGLFFVRIANAKSIKTYALSLVR